MIQVTVYRDSSQNCTGFEIKGHAGFAKAGKDIICAAVSALVINAVNSVEEFTADKFTFSSDEETGYMNFQMTDTISSESKILLNSLVFGLEGIEKDNKKYIHMVFKEV